MAKTVYEKRIENLRREMAREGLDCVVVPCFESTIPDVYYYTGFLDEGTNILVVTMHDAVLMAWDKEKALSSCMLGCRIVPLGEHRLSSLLGDLGVSRKTIGVDYRAPHYFVEGLEKKLSGATITDASRILERIRSVKDPGEIEEIKRACVQTDGIIKSIIEEGVKNKSEDRIAREILSRMIEKGVEPAFRPIVASGVSSSWIHHQPSTRRIKDNILIDCGVSRNFYCSDVTRSLVLENNREMSRALETLERLHHELETVVRAGSEIGMIAGFARKFLSSAGYEDSGFHRFHALGHGVGLRVHEHPSISEKAEGVLEEGMVITLEPAIYKKGEWGVRIEDTVLVKKNGFERLSRLPLVFS